MKIQSQEYAQAIVGQVLAGARVSKAVKPTHDGKQHSIVFQTHELELQTFFTDPHKIRNFCGSFPGKQNC